MNNYQHIQVELSEYVAVLTMNSPPYNFIDEHMLGEMLNALQQLEEDPNCRCVVLASSGSAFCAGADFKSSLAEGADLDEFTKRFYSTAMKLFEFGKPMVAAVEGAAVGAGFGITLLADFRVVSQGATMSANFNRLGIHPGFGMSVTLPRLVGEHNAALLFYTGRRIKGVEAAKLGLVTQLVDPGEALNGAVSLAKQIALSSPLAVQHTRATLRASLLATIRDANRHEQAIQAQEMLTEDFKEGVLAASERRDPRFKGV